MRFLWGLGVCCVIAVLGGCASIDPYSFTYKEVSDPSKILKKSSGNVTIVSRREPGFTGSAATCYFTIDGEKIVELNPGEEYKSHVPPGQYVVGYFCTPFSYSTEMGLLANSGKTYWFRLYALFGQSLQIAPMSR